MAGTRFAPHQAVGEGLGGFEGRPSEGDDARKGKSFLVMLKEYSDVLRGISFTEADKPLLSGLKYNVIGYDGATKIGEISFA
jgi:hypothetical protein